MSQTRILRGTATVCCTTSPKTDRARKGVSALKKRKITKKGILNFLKTTSVVLVGNALLAFFVAAFVIPHDIIMGGTTGIGIVLNKTLSIDTAALIFIINNALLIFGGIVLGKKFFLTTVASSVLYPAMLAVMMRVPNIGSITDNQLLAALVGGCLQGLSVGILMRVGSSTGGIDVVNLVLHKWFHLSLAAFVFINDVLVVGGQALFAKPEQLLLGIVVIFCETVVIEQVVIFGKSQIQVYAVSSRYDEIRKKVLTELGLGVTMTMIETGLLAERQKGVLCVVPPRRLHAVTELIQSIDPDAFITITKIKEVRGHGFTLERYTRTGELERLK